VGDCGVHNDFTRPDFAFDLLGGIVGITSGSISEQRRRLATRAILDHQQTRDCFDLPPNAGFANEVKEPWLSTYRGRFGYAQQNWMVYATAGGALARVENNFAGPPGQLSEKHWHWGWTVGGGVEMRLTPDWSAKVEYLYVGLQDKSYFAPAPTPRSKQPARDA
jgi:opacity protein-like surface antigen